MSGPKKTDDASGAIDWSFLDQPGWQSFIDAISSGIAVYDENNALVAANQAFYAFTDLPPDLHLNKTSYRSIVEQLARREWYGPGDVEEIVSTRIETIDDRQLQHLRMWTPARRAIDIKLDFPPCGGFITVMTDITELETEKMELHLASTQDALTKLPNRRHFDDEMDKFLALVRRTQATGALIMFDLDGFKAVNDLHGHPVGDDVLINVAGAVRDSIREVDLGARLGGDEFAVIIRGLSSVDEAHAAVEQVDARLREAVQAVDIDPKVNTSAGAKIIGPQEAPKADIVEAADAALYKAKEAGKGRLAFA